MVTCNCNFDLRFEFLRSYSFLYQLPFHQLSGGKARVTLRSLLGDAFAAAGESASAELWGQSTVELQEGIEMEKQTLPFPRDKLVSELIQLSGLYRKLGMAADAKRCLEDALEVMELIYWASESPEAKQMKRDIEEALKA